MSVAVCTNRWVPDLKQCVNSQSSLLDPQKTSQITVPKCWPEKHCLLKAENLRLGLHLYDELKLRCLRHHSTTKPKQCATGLPLLLLLLLLLL